MDTSAWVEFLRGTGSSVHHRLRAEIETGTDLLVPELVVMEILVGATDEAMARRLRTMLHSFEVVALAPLVDSEQAAALQRRCRATGRAVRSMIDCLVAATALRLGHPVLHLDRDFELLASVSELELVAA
ncbi:MAG: type II toxin-antitoxin system VapC family toxin [Acidimicrobiales bacterium]